MTQQTITPDGLVDHRDPMRAAFAAALTLHVAGIGALAFHAWMGNSEAFGDKNPGGGAVSIQSVSSIPIPHHGCLLYTSR